MPARVFWPIAPGGPIARRPASATHVALERFTTFGDLLKYLRRRAGLTQRELSIAVGYSHGQISRLEQNQRVPDPATLAARFAPALDIEDEPAVLTRLLELAAAARREDAPAPTDGAAPAARHNLPAQLTSFIGREREIAEVRRLLSSSRLVTLSGVGGTGKTRLALEVAAESVAEYSDGVWLVEFAPLSDPALVPQKLALTLGLREEPDRPLATTLANYLRVKNTLLLLDNCEHLIEACAQLAQTLLHACPNMRIMATSREGLGIPGETSVQVPTLSLPEAGQLLTLDALTQSEAVQLFVDRAEMALPGFAVTEQNAPAVAQVCRQLDGIPLAIELAATRVKTLKVEQIVMRLEDRFGLLTGGSRTALPRHQTLSALIDWSYSLLSESERVLLRRLSVFRGGWTLEAAEAVCAGVGQEAISPAPRRGRYPQSLRGERGLRPARSLEAQWGAGVSYDVLDLLTQLVNKSLVRVEHSSQRTDRAGGGEARYHMLETIRQYAGEKLLESRGQVETRNRHLEYFLSLAEQSDPQSRGSDLKWVEGLEIEHDNLRAALEWSQMAEGAVELGLRLAGALVWFWLLRCYFSEGRERLAAALSNTEALKPTAARAGALFGAADLAWLQSDFPTARSLYEESLTISRELGPAGQRGVAWALSGLGAVATETGDYVTDRSLLEEALAMMKELKDVSGTATVLLELGSAAMRPGEYLAAEARLEEALALFREMDNRRGIGLVLSSLGEAALRQGQYDRADRLLAESLSLQRESRDKWGIAASLGSLAWVALRQGDFQRARALLAESVALRQDIGEKGGIAWCLEREAEMAADEGKAERAVRLCGAAASLRASVDSAIDPVDQPEHERRLTALRDQLGEAAFATAWAEGRAMTLEQAIACALEPIA